MPYDQGGKPRSGFGRMRAANEAHGGVAVMEKPKAAPPAAHAGDISHMPIQAAVKAHGPATEVHITHDHEAGTHHVHSVHGGKNHHSDHPHAHGAHRHAMMAGGAEHTDENEESPDTADETPDDEAEEGEEVSSMASNKIPGIK